MTAVRKRDINDAFWQKRILPVEDARRIDPPGYVRPGYRWFRAGNVIPIEQWRRVIEEPPKPGPGKG